ncbi:components of type IV pilus, pilin subunit [Aureimonas sp. SA4125]|uniref:Flp family type IVb pilin n=1 Tax=Aureimonas sp. SA4125 TaxID=2826993 RepID=UPI001CC4BE39|nr:Flp family type IVb pilin [Aureimonas sp. SA4125]BDA82647.1 components of type IV pilus, pilin subunit [Aureimonas sp. SA4125]
MTKTLKRFINNESGATAIEYALIAGIMATALIAAFTVLSPALLDAFTSIGETMQVQ